MSKIFSKKIILVISFIGLFFVNNVYAETLRNDQQDAGTDFWNLGTACRAEVFTTSEAYRLTRFEVYIYRGGTGTWTGKLLDTSGGVPVDPYLVKVDVSDPGGASQWLSFDVPNVDLESGHTYAISISLSTGAGGPYGYQNGLGGQYEQAACSGSYTAYGSDSLAYKVYGEDIVAGGGSVATSTESEVNGHYIVVLSVIGLFLLGMDFIRRTYPK